ncbi:hypothetical protein CAPTEDRAFT_187768 [Capitella teleta]|uniref:Uncharacterized protein n=1 Tax=Capitella teleta TaxID=283909 RepID=R7UAE8_CAPTE|nr:hypothetical protein CAPTEDRAFT_187768 [Capitella teleta]|eukprot:ELU03340.1 hypothetical protein CAPTEDRAFT_187768 [Capitella teleta]
MEALPEHRADETVQARGAGPLSLNEHIPAGELTRSEESPLLLQLAAQLQTLTSWAASVQAKLAGPHEEEEEIQRPSRVASAPPAFYEDISPPQVEEEPAEDPFAASALEGFALPAVAGAMSVGRDAPTATEKEAAIWTMFRGDQKPRKIARDKTERLYRQTEGPFAPPSYPTQLPVSQQQMQADRAACAQQAQWGMCALAVTRGLAKLEEAVQELSGAASTEDVHRVEAVIASDVTIPFAHAVRMMASVFNEHSIQRRGNIARAVSDPHLSRWLEESEASFTDLFAGNTDAALEASRARRTDGLLAVARQATTSRPASSKGNRSAPYAPRPRNQVSRDPAVAAEATPLQQQTLHGTLKQKEIHAFQVSRKTLPIQGYAFWVMLSTKNLHQIDSSYHSLLPSDGH